MIYLDCAATSLQKPPEVGNAVVHAVHRLASPGRGAYASAMEAADTLFECRVSLADMFHAIAPENVVFTSNATHALNIAIKSIVCRGDKVVISGYEHNAVLRPLHAAGAKIEVADAALFAPEQMIASFRERLPGAKAAVCTHVSNVFGYVLPIAEIAALCREYGVPLIIDASQSAGCFELDFDELGCCFMAMPGHKGLLGPQGTGVLLCRDRNTKTLLEGGTGSNSELEQMPDFLPDRLEAGTHNMPGIAGLCAGVRWIERKRIKTIYRHECELMRYFIRELRSLPGVRIFASDDEAVQSGVLSVQFDSVDCEDAARMLGEAGIAVRAGLHCAPLAHRTAGTIQEGTVRFSFSPFNTWQEATRAVSVIRRLFKQSHI